MPQCKAIWEQLNHGVNLLSLAVLFELLSGSLVLGLTYGGTRIVWDSSQKYEYLFLGVLLAVVALLLLITATTLWCVKTVATTSTMITTLMQQLQELDRENAEQDDAEEEETTLDYLLQTQIV